MTTPAPDTLITAEDQAAATPEEVVDWLREGNIRFALRSPAPRDLLGQAEQSSWGQHPLAAVLGCIDSRVPVEAVLDLGIGDAFVARTAGNVADDDILGSLEFATEVAGAKVVLVMGHSSCGAVKGACDGVQLGHLTGLLARITPSVRTVTGEDAPGSGDPEVVAAVVEQHVRDVVAGLTARSEVLAARVEAGTLLVVGAVYDLARGRVRWLD